MSILSSVSLGAYKGGQHCCFCFGELRHRETLNHLKGEMQNSGVPIS